MDRNPPSCWNSIEERVRLHIPSIDFDSSSSENEEVITIYQRPAGHSLEVPEDFDSFSVDCDEPEVLKPTAHTSWLEEIYNQSVELEDEIKDVSTAAQWDKPSSDVESKRGAMDTEIEGPKSEVSVTANMDCTKSSEGFPILSFARIDQWDLDDVLKNLNVERPFVQPLSTEPTKTYIDGDRDRRQKDIMERLVALYNSQVSVSEPAKSPNRCRRSNMWNKSAVQMTAELQENPTVYIDLRCPDPLIKLAKVSSNLSSESAPPAEHNSHQEVPHAEKLNLKGHARSRTGTREMTGKSMLLQKIREANRTGNKYPAHSGLGNESEEQKTKPEPLCNHKLHHRKSKMEGSATTQLQLEQHQQILKQLETHRPTKSVNQKQVAADKTDVLYDFEASHLQSISTLPGGIEDKARMLLKVELFSPGMVGDRPQSRRNHPYPAATKCHVFNTLVAWFLSLVGPEPQHDEDPDGAKVPFWVAGLQQLWTEDGLALHVLAVARHSYTRRKRDTDVHAPFYKHVSRFLSETSLPLIAGRHQALTTHLHLPNSSLSHFISATSNKEVIGRTFGLSPGFYWQTVEAQERVCKGKEARLELHTEVAVILGSKTFFLRPLITHHTLQFILESGLDVCGLRLLYPPPGFLSESTGALPVLALAVRGPHAHSVLKDFTGSLDLMLPREMHPGPLDPPLFCVPQLAAQVHRELCLWFSGRLDEGNAQNLNQYLNRDLPLEDQARSGPLSLSRSPFFLCATTKADLLLLVSPAVPQLCYGQVLAVCERRGFSLRGVQRLQLHIDGVAVLGLSNQQTLVFCSPHTFASDQGDLELPSHCLLLLLGKENAQRHSVSLPAALLREFEAQDLLSCIRSRLGGAHRVEPNLCFHITPYHSNLFNGFVRCMWAVPGHPGMILHHHQSSPSSTMKQVVVLTLRGKDLSQGLSLLHRALTEGDGKHMGMELLGVKFLPALSQLQAQELSPYEVGEQLWHHSLDVLTSSPALVCALRGADAFVFLKTLLPLDYPADLSVLMSPTPEVSLRQTSLFFLQHEMIAGPGEAPLLKLLSQNHRIKDPQMQLTACLLQPATWTDRVAKMADTLQRSGLALVGLRVLTLDRGSAASLLPAPQANLERWCSGSSLALCLEGEDAVRKLLVVLGGLDSSLWATRAGTAHLRSGIYASGSYRRAIQDVKRLFPQGLCCPETSVMRQEEIVSVSSDPIASVERAQRCTLVPVAQESLPPSGPSDGGSPLIDRSLWQTTCLLLPMDTPPLSREPPQLGLLQLLLNSGCHLVAGRMSTLDSEQRRHIGQMLSVEDEKVAPLSSAPCLIVALQGETIVTQLNLILESILKDHSGLEEVGRTMIYPGTEKEARQLICYLFDALSPESCHIVTS